MKNDMDFDFRFLRPLKAEWMRKWYDTLQFRTNIEYDAYDQAIVFPYKSFRDGRFRAGGGVNVAAGTQLSCPAMKDLVVGNYALENIKHRDETAVYCGFFIEHWGHFITECVNRLWFFLEHNKPEYRYIFIVEEGKNTEIKGNFEAFFELLGMKGRIELINTPVQYGKMIIPEISFNHLEFYSRQYQEIFEKVIQEALKLPSGEKENTASKVFLSRSAFPKARETEFGLDLLDHYFEKNGFEIIHPETVSLESLIALMHRAEIIAAESGSISHNMLFCEYGKNFVIVERQTVVNRYQASIDCVKKPRAPISTRI